MITTHYRHYKQNPCCMSFKNGFIVVLYLLAMSVVILFFYFAFYSYKFNIIQYSSIAR